MHDNQSTDSSSSTNVKRYAQPNQRNKINRRKSGDRLDRACSLHGNNGEKNSSAPSCVIPLAGCANSEVSQFLNDRWQSTMHRLHNTADPSDKPVLYTSSPGSAWGQFRLPRQMSGSPTSQIDFLSELERSMQNSGIDFN